MAVPLQQHVVLRCLLGLLASLALAGSAHAQLPSLTGDSEEKKGAAPAQPVPVERRSARATMRTFIDSTVAASRYGDSDLLGAATDCLDLTELPASVGSSGARDLTIKLKEVIDRIRLIDFSEVPDDPRGDPYVFYEDPKLAAEIVIAPNANGEWLFSASTVRRIEDLYRHFELQPKVAGVGGSGIEMSRSLWLRSQMPPELRETGFLLEHWQWLGILVLIVVGWLLARIARMLLHGPVHRYLERREWAVPRERVWRLVQPSGFMVTAVLWWVGLGLLGLPHDIQIAAMLVVKFMVAIAVVRMAFRLIDLITWMLAQKAAETPTKLDDLLVPFFDKTAKLVVIVIGIVFIADVLGLSPTSLLAGVGIGGLAVALAAQETVKNLLGSITILLDRPFEVGDDVKIGEFLGTVESVGFRSTRVRTWDHTLVTIPNGTLISASIDNWGRRPFYRYKALISIEYSTPPERIHAFCTGLKELVAHHPETRKEVVRAALHELGPHSLDILFICHFAVESVPASIEARHRLLLDVVTLASRLGVGFAFPTRTLHMLPVDPDRAPPPLAINDTAGIVEAERFGRAEALAIAEAQKVAEESSEALPEPPPEPPTA